MTCKVNIQPISGSDRDSPAKTAGHDPEQAVHLLSLMAGLSPGQTSSLAEILAASQQPELALLCYSQALDLDPENRDLHKKFADLAGNLQPAGTN